MQPPSIPLALAAAAFLAGLLWRVRPVFTQPLRRRAESREALQEAHARIAQAPDDASKARALCDAADQVSRKVGGTGGASLLYLRALRADPRSLEVLARAVAGLGRRPKRLESLLWRYLAASPWRGPTQACARAALDALRALYEGPLKNQVRARALANARDGLVERG